MNQVLLKREAVTILQSEDRTQIVHLPCNCPFFPETLRSLTSDELHVIKRRKKSLTSYQIPYLEAS